MGDSADNLTVKPHKLRGSGNNVSDYSLHRHLGNQSIDTTSGECNRAKWVTFRDAALNGSDNDMDSAGQDAWGSWYDDHIVTPGNRGTLRGLIVESCG